MKIYLTQYSYDPDSSLEEVIEDYFDDFNISIYEDYELEQEHEPDLFKSFEEAYNSGNGYTNLTIVEYELSEEDLFNIIMTKEIKSKPINVWFYNYDKDIEDLKLIKNIQV